MTPATQLEMARVYIALFVWWWLWVKLNAGRKRERCKECGRMI